MAWGAAAVFVLALSVRLAHLWQLSDSPFWSVLLGDAGAYDTWARRLAHGSWFASDAFYQAPLYPYTLGVLYAWFGPNLTLVRIAQAILGSGACTLVCLAGDGWFGRPAGIASGLLLAVYGPALFLGGLLQKSALDAFLFSGLLLLIAPSDVGASRARTLVLGMTGGCFALTRENGLIFIPVLVLWLLVARDRRRTVAAFLIGLVVVLAPVAVHNKLAGTGWELTTSQLGPNLYIGNSDTATGTYVALRRGRGNAEFEQQDATAFAAEAMGRSLSPSQVSDYWRDRAFAWIRQDPARWAKLYAFKLLLAANRHEAADTEDIWSHAEWSWPLKLTNWLFNFGLLAPLAVVGAWITRRRWRDLWVLYTLGASYLLSVALFYVLDRYRYPLVPVLSLFAGVAVGDAVEWWRRSGPFEMTSAVAMLGVAALICNWPIAILSANAAMAVTHYNLGYTLQVAGQNDQAIGEYRTAERLLPSDPEMHLNLGVALAAAGKDEDAVIEYREAIRLDPRMAEARNNLGMVLASAGRYREAIEQFDEALRLDPRSAAAHYNRGTAMAAQGQPEAAIAEFRKTLELDPRNASAHNNLGALFAAAGQLSAAVEQFQLALRLQPEFPGVQANLARATALMKQRR
jgi:Flp pilus assembly protein TadD